MDDGFSADPAGIEAIAAAFEALMPALTDSARALGHLAPDAGASTFELGGGLHHLGGEAAEIVFHLEALASGLHGAAAGYRAADSITSRTFPGGASTGRSRP
jgi:hypothetical protein